MSVYIENRMHHNLARYLPRYKTFVKFNIQNAIKKYTKKITYWMERSKQRKELAELDDRMLNDIGYTRAEVQKETSKPFWR